MNKQGIIGYWIIAILSLAVLVGAVVYFTNSSGDTEDNQEDNAYLESAVNNSQQIIDTVNDIPLDWTEEEKDAFVAEVNRLANQTIYDLQHSNITIVPKKKHHHHPIAPSAPLY